MPIKIDANRLNVYQQVDKNRQDIEELNSKIESQDSKFDDVNGELSVLDTKIDNVNVKVQYLDNNYKTEFHLIETIEYHIESSQFDNLEKSVTFENPNFKLIDSLVSWCPSGTIENVNVIAESNIVLLEQTEEGKISFACENIPSKAIDLKVIVNLLGNYGG